MPDYLRFELKKTRRLSLEVCASVDFRRVLHTLERIRLPAFVANQDNVKYALLELVSNSLRAHRERSEPRPVHVALRSEQGRLRIAVRDYGGGFDPASLPYDLDDLPARVDHNSKEFHEYQRRNGFQRFGMGLLIARRTFPEFELRFLDGQDRAVPWAEGRVQGTLITLGIGGDHDGL